MDSDKGPSKNKQAGIFSSPDLTVDTEKLAGIDQNTPVAKMREPQSSDRSSSGKKRNFIPFVVIAAVILLIGGIVAGIALSKNASRESSSATEPIQKFNQFAAYLLFMENSTELTGEYEPGHS